MTSLPGNPDVVEVDEAVGDVDGDERTAPPELSDDLPGQGDQQNLMGIFTTAPRVPSGTTVGKVVTHRRRFPAGSAMWEWQVYVPRAARTQLEKFELSLRAELGGAKPVDLAGPAVSTEWIRKNWQVLKRSYPVLSRHRNLTSLCIYSGPPAGAPVRTWLSFPPGRLTLPLEPGWLSAGDADLATGPAACAFTDMFAPVLDHVGTFAIPHHGAATSWNDALLDRSRNVVDAHRCASWERTRPEGTVIRRRTRWHPSPATAGRSSSSTATRAPGGTSPHWYGGNAHRECRARRLAR